MPNRELLHLGIESRILNSNNALPRSGVIVVQGKWLLDAGAPDALRSRMGKLTQAREAGATLLLDSFDNYFLNESGDPLRESLLQAYREALPLFHAFTVSSPGLQSLLAKELPTGASVHVIGDPVETPKTARGFESLVRRCHPGRWRGHINAWQELAEHRQQRRLARQLIWFGNHGSAYASGGMDELERLLPMLDAVAVNQPLRLTVVSNSETHYREVMRTARFPHRYRQWDRLHFLTLLGEQDLVLLPSRLTSFTRAKSNNRLLLALAQGVPVMTDALPDYLPWKAFCAIDEWNLLANHIESPQALAERALAAKPEIESQYSTSAIASQWNKLLQLALRH